MMEYYPNSKVILTLREPEKWYDSFYTTIGRMGPAHPQHYWGIHIFNWFRPFWYLIKWHAGVREQRFYSPETLATKENTIKAFNDWTEEVKRTVPEEKLLIFHPKMGWEPLCKFLDVPIPEQPFPRVNDRERMKKVMCFFLFRGIAACIFFPSLLWEWAVFWWNDGFRDIEKNDVDVTKKTR